MKRRFFKMIASFMALTLILSMFSVGASAASVLTTPKLSITAYTTPMFKLSWDKVSGANKYYVYKLEGTSGTMKLVAKTSNLYYQDKDIKKNTVYSYKVRAYNITNGKITNKSELSNLVKKAVVTISKASNLKAQAVSSDKIKLSWGKVTNADRYYLYYSTSKNGTYKSVGYLKFNSTSYTFSNLNSNTTYYFKVKATKYLDGLNYSAGYSTAVSAKTQAKAGEFIVDFERISNKEAGLPTGSAITCLAMLLKHNGVDVKPKDLVPYFNCSTDFYYKNGELYGPYAMESFIGDPYSNKAYSYGTEIPTVGTAYEKYVKEEGINLRTDDAISSYNFVSIKDYVKNGGIILIKVATGPYEDYFSCYTDDKYGRIRNMLYYNQKYVIIYGVTDTDIIVYDPLLDKNEQYEYIWGQTITATLGFKVK